MRGLVSLRQQLVRTNQLQAMQAMRFRNPADYPALRQSEYRPGSEHDVVWHTSKMAGYPDGGIEHLKADDNSEPLPDFETAALKRVVEVITAGSERRFPFEASADKTRQTIKNWQCRKPQAMDRRNHTFRTL